MTSINDFAWIEFSYVDGDTEVAVQGAPSLVREVADNLPDELTGTATVYCDPDGEGHCHLHKTDFTRNPDGSWPW